MRHDWKALRSLHIRADDEVSVEARAAGVGLDEDSIVGRATKVNCGNQYSSSSVNAWGAFKRPTSRNAGAPAVFNALWIRTRRRTIHCEGEGQP
jgi:hypothetical protein